MERQSSPLRMLAKTHANALITREQYIQIRARMLKKLDTRGSIDESDLTNFSKLAEASDGGRAKRTYTASDWIIIGLGLAASAVLAYVLYA